MLDVVQHVVDHLRDCLVLGDVPKVCHQFDCSLGLELPADFVLLRWVVRALLRCGLNANDVKNRDQGVRNPPEEVGDIPASSGHSTITMLR